MPADDRSDDEVMLDLEISLVRALGWSLAEIDRTDAESLMAFLDRFNETDGGENIPQAQRAYCDQVDWL